MVDAHQSSRGVTSRGRLIQALFVIGALGLIFWATRHDQESALPRYEETQFGAAVERGEDIVILVHANWCPTCARMDETLSTMAGEPTYSDVRFIHVDFDDQRAAVDFFEAQAQSTLVVYSDGTEVARTIAETDPMRLRTFIATSLRS